MRNRNVLSSPRLLELKKRRKKAIFNKFFVCLFCFLVILITLIYFSRLDRFNINEIQIIGNKVLENETLKTEVLKQITGKYLWFFPKTNFLIYPQHKIETELKDKFKRIKDVFINDKNIKTLEISLVEREALYTWCGEVIPVLNSNSNQKCYFVDSDGYIFEEAPYFSGGVYFKFYGQTKLDGENPSGFYFLQNKFKEIVKLKNIIKEIGLAPVAFWLDNKGDANFALSSEPTMGGTIIFKLESDFEQIAENLDAALTTEPLKSEFKNKYASLLYIDLRFGNKVYYKFQ